ncbi:MAG: efflux RND transporter periplasmic adaptor subunit [Vicinamibacteria bacterium]
MRRSRRTAGLKTFAIVLAAAMGAQCHKDAPAEEKPEPTAVRTEAAAEGAITEWIELQGRVSAPFDRDATLAPLVPGRIVSLGVRVGDVVAAGQVLARIETGTLDDELRTAEAASRRSEADLTFKRGVAKRSNDLVAKGVAAREEAEGAVAAAVAAESALAENQASLATARRRRAWSELTSPFAGIVVRIDRRIGDFVDGTASTPVLEVASADGWEIVASATSVSLQRLRAGQSATIQGLESAQATKDGESNPLGAVVTTIARAVDVTTGAGDVRLRPTDRPANVALGAPVQARIAVRSKPQAMLVPAAAVRLASDGSSEVVVMEGGVAHVRKVETGLVEAGHVEIVSGVKAGERVVVEDPIGIADGAALVEEAAVKKDEGDSPAAKPAGAK